MTVYSGVLARHQTIQTSARVENKLVFRLNLALIAVAMFTAVFYVFVSNFLVAQKYALNSRKAQFNQLNARQSTGERYGADLDLKRLSLFAQKSGMVEAKDTDSVLQKEGFAINH